MICLKELNSLAVQLTAENSRSQLMRLASVPLNSKVVSSDKVRLASLCVDAVSSIWDEERRVCDLERIRFVEKEGGTISDTRLFHGVVLKKRFSHESMPKVKQNAKIAVLSCPLESQRPKTNYAVKISEVQHYDDVRNISRSYFQRIIKKLQECEVNVVVCQWGFDLEMNSLLFASGILGITWVDGGDLEDVALAVGATICPKVDMLTKQMVGSAGKISEISITNGGEEYVVIEECSQAKLVTFMVRGTSQMVCKECSTALYDSVCVVKTIFLDGRILFGAGAAEIELHNALLAKLAEAKQVAPIEQYAVRAFANALLSIPSALAENAGLSPVVDICSRLISEHVKGNKSSGINRISAEVDSTAHEEVIEPFGLKHSMLTMATDLVSMVLKVDEIVTETTIPLLIGPE
eukprot:TRINITY_DN3961_c0_g1_i3.p1 TRINITY_DN3961_c0_g1~~TRINITY_DN3961_c0_g1_i3.p1  ORF type:complete len:408 (-),score=65.37 TRINITY_DN3961_c0_g1_i3:69-1292(-)